MKIDLPYDLVYHVCCQCAQALYSYRLTRLNHLHDPQRATLGEYDRERGEIARDTIRKLLRSADKDDRQTLRIYIRESFRYQREQGDISPRWQDQTQRVLRAHPDHVPARTMNKLNTSIAAGTWLPDTASARTPGSTATQSTRKPAPATTLATANAGEMGEVAA
ncbi:MAG: hypothetical protein LBK99_15555 [Opitutaceae bacterium]|jgi:hypothetical protein|nr:hypothetical protein [Opitutaceae bacterium]